MITKNINISETQIIIFFSIPLFVIQPFFLFFFVFLYGLYVKGITRKFLYFFVFLGSFFLSMINISKLPESDLLNYIEAFETAKDITLNEFS